MQHKQYKYETTKEKILEYCRNLDEGQALPNRNELSKQFGVARVTLERAISELVGEGFLISKDGSGTYPAKKTGSTNPQNSAGRFWALLGYDVTKGLNAKILRGIEDYAYARNISLIVCNTDNDPQKESMYLKRLAESSVSGIILVPNVNSNSDFEAIQTLKEKRIPLVACSRQITGEDIPGAFQNFFYAGYMSVQHLIDLGCRHIVYIASDVLCSVEDRYQGCLAAAVQYNSTHKLAPVTCEIFREKDEEGIDVKIAEYIDSHPETDGMFLGSDRLALPLFNVMKKKGLYPGKDIRIIASEDSGFCSCFWVPMSVVENPSYEMAVMAAEQLYLMQNGECEKNLKREIMSGELILRESSEGTL